MIFRLKCSIQIWGGKERDKKKKGGDKGGGGGSFANLETAQAKFVSVGILLNFTSIRTVEVLHRQSGLEYQNQIFLEEICLQYDYLEHICRLQERVQLGMLFINYFILSCS